MILKIIASILLLFAWLVIDDDMGGNEMEMRGYDWANRIFFWLMCMVILWAVWK